MSEKDAHRLLWGSGLGDAAASKNVQLGRLLKSLVELNGGWWWVKALLAPGEEKVLTRGIILCLLAPLLLPINIFTYTTINLASITQHANTCKQFDFLTFSLRNVQFL